MIKISKPAENTLLWKLSETLNLKATSGNGCRGFFLGQCAFSLRAVVLAIFLIGGHTYAQQYDWSNFAGSPGASGTADGIGNATQFNSPGGVAVDANGTAYIADTNNHTIRKMTPGGVVTTLAGNPGASGSADGTGGAARFCRPQGVAVDGSGNVYVADAKNCAIRKVTPGGVVTTLAGSPGTSGTADGMGSAARFAWPHGVAVDGSGNVYVADTGNNTIRKVTPSGVVTTLAGSPGVSGSADGTGSAARFSYSRGIAVDGNGNAYVADYLNHTIRKVTSAGVVTTLAGTPEAAGCTDGTGSAARFDWPHGIAADGSGNVYVADIYNHTIRKVTPGGAVTTLAGNSGTGGSVDGTGNAARFTWPHGVAVDGSGNVYIADSGNHTIRKVTPTGEATTLAGSPGTSGSSDGQGSSNGIGSAAQFFSPRGVAVDGSANVYVADTYNHTIRKVTPSGVVTTLAGSPRVSGTAEGTGSSARFTSPQGVAVDANGNIYVADTNNHVIREVTPNGVVTTLAGSPKASGTADGTGSAAQFTQLQGVAVDGSGNLYVADINNHTIRKVAPSGVVTTLAGSPGVSGTADGTGSSAQFFLPQGVAVDGNGNVYVADTNNHTIRKVTPVGVVTTLAGSPRVSGTADGTGSAAQFSSPQGVAVDGSGNVYVADTANHTIRKVTPSGIVITIGGKPGMAGKQAGVGPSGLFSFPSCVVVSLSNGILYVADSGNHRISKGMPTW